MIDPRSRKLFRFMLVSGVWSLTTAAWLLLRRQAYYEPHYSFAASDVLLYVGMNFVLMTLLAVLASLVVFGMATRRLGLWWTLALPWIFLVFLVCMGGVKKWIHDQEWRQNISERQLGSSTASPPLESCSIAPRWYGESRPS